MIAASRAWLTLIVVTRAHTINCKKLRAATVIDTSALAYPKIHPKRDRRYLKWLRYRECAIKGKLNQRTDIRHICYRPDGFCDPCHIAKALSGRLKVSDHLAIPLCRDAHWENESNMQRFDDDYGINRFELAAEYYARFLEETK